MLSVGLGVDALFTTSILASRAVELAFAFVTNCEVRTLGATFSTVVFVGNDIGTCPIAIVGVGIAGTNACGGICVGQPSAYIGATNDACVVTADCAEGNPGHQQQANAPSLKMYHSNNLLLTRFSLFQEAISAYHWKYGTGA